MERSTDSIEQLVIGTPIGRGEGLVAGIVLNAVDEARASRIRNDAFSTSSAVSCVAAPGPTNPNPLARETAIASDSPEMTRIGADTTNGRETHHGYRDRSFAVMLGAWDMMSTVGDE